MPNVHLQEAANNMRKAVNDVRLKQQETQADAVNKVKELTQRVKDIDLQKKVLQTQQVQAQDEITKTGFRQLTQKLDDEVKQVQKSISDLQMNAQRQVQDLDKQAYDFESLAGRLEGMA